MGITFSSEPPEDESQITLQRSHELLLKAKNRMRLSYEEAAKIVKAYVSQVYSPILDEASLQAMIYTSLRKPDSRHDNNEDINELASAMWTLFHDANTFTMRAQEMLAVLVLLSEAPWNKRLFLLFDLFKCMGTDYLMHEDIQLAAHCSASGLFRLWRVEPWPFDDFKALTEGIADNAYLKLGKEIDTNVDCDQFLVWAQDRFKPSRTIATAEALHAIYTSAY